MKPRNETVGNPIVTQQPASPASNELSIRQAASELGESVQLTAWLIEVGRIARPVTVSSIRAYREAETAIHGVEGRIRPGTLGHLWRPGTRKSDDSLLQ